MAEFEKRGQTAAPNIHWSVLSIPRLHYILTLLEDAERKKMSSQVVSSLENQSPSRVIDNLEKYELCGIESEPFAHFRGPFGASRWSELRPVSNIDVIPVASDEPCEELEQFSADDNANFPLWRSDDLETDLYDHIFPEVSQVLPQDDIEIYTQEPTMRLEPSAFPNGGNIEGWTLLSYYKDRIVPLISPLRRGQETSWMSLVMPCAVTTLGELALNGTVNHARLALLNAIWSTSAFHLGNNLMGCFEQWKISGEKYLARAQYHFQQCMQESCLSTGKISKYKETLMAILSLSNVFVRFTAPIQRV